jgi:hypothetical protein
VHRIPTDWPIDIREGGPLAGEGPRLARSQGFHPPLQSHAGQESTKPPLVSAEQGTVLRVDQKCFLEVAHARF